MELRLILAATIAAIAVLSLSSAAVPHQKQCSSDRECITLTSCGTYQAYIGNKGQNVPIEVQNEIKSLYCGLEMLTSGKKAIKICCAKPGRNLLDLESCGRQTGNRIANGQIASIFQFPWMALLQGYDGTFHCGGSLIAARYVLTATHCRRKRVRSVRLGETDLSSTIDCIRYTADEIECADNPQDILAEKFIAHPQYSSSRKKNDIALVKLARAAKFNDNVRPICLPLPEFLSSIAPTRLIVSGWGFTEDQLETSNQLRFANVPIVDLQQCNQSVVRMSHGISTVDESQICAGAGIEKADSCQGDSGGPLKYFGNGRFVVQGVVSFGQASCGSESEPGVYANVLHYLSWIIDQLQ